MAKQIKAFKFRLYPTLEQKQFLSNQFGAARFVYNFFLNNRKLEYLNNKKSINYYDDARSLTALKEQDGYAWLYDINAQTLQASLRNSEVAYTNFFNKKAAFPRFHNKKNNECIKIPQHFSIVDKKLYIPKLKKQGIKIIIPKKIKLPEKIQCLYLSKTASRKYYASFQCEVEIKPLLKNNNIIGIDLGLKDLVIISDGRKIENKKFAKQLEKELKYQQRQLSKKQKGSKNREKARIQLAKINEYIANSRKDYLHKVSKKLIDENQVIIVESLVVKNMVKLHTLAGAIHDASWGELLRQLTYKAEWYGRTLYKIDRWFPSSKTCHSCQFVVDALHLNIREWNCSQCGEHHDRDVNAATNIKNKGIRDLVDLKILPKKALKDLSGHGICSDIKQKLVEALVPDQRIVSSAIKTESVKQETSEFIQK